MKEWKETAYDTVAFTFCLIVNSLLKWIKISDKTVGELIKGRQALGAGKAHIGLYYQFITIMSS